MNDWYPVICDVILSVPFWRFGVHRSSGNGVGCTNEVTLIRWARLVLQGWQTIFGRANRIGICNLSPRPTQPPTFSGMENEYRPKRGDGVWLESKDSHGSHSICR